MKLIGALDAAGVELIGEGAASAGRRPRGPAQVSAAARSVLACVGALLALVLPASRSAGAAAARWVVYGGALLVCACGAARRGLTSLLGLAGGDADVVLPLGLPWIGARFHLDALAAVFLVVVNLGGAAASLYALGYGRHEAEPQRVLPFYPAFLAGMNLVVLAADAFTFLVAWEVMSLASWGLVMARHREPDNARAGYVYLLMASFGALCLLLAFGLLAGPQRRLRLRRPCAPTRRRAAIAGAGPGCWRSWARARRPASSRCTSGCRSPTRPRPATSRP